MGRVKVKKIVDDMNGRYVRRNRYKVITPSANRGALRIIAKRRRSGA